MAARGADVEIVRGQGWSAGLCIAVYYAVKGKKRGGVRRRVARKIGWIMGEFTCVAISPSFGKADGSGTGAQIHHADASCME